MEPLTLPTSGSVYLDANAMIYSITNDVTFKHVPDLPVIVLKEFQRL